MSEFNIDIETPHGTEGSPFLQGDIIRLKDGESNDCWVRVMDVPIDMGTFWRYGCSLAYKDGNGTGEFKSGLGIPDYGDGITDGGGFIVQSADTLNSPYISIQDHTGTPWIGTEERMRFGNLNGYQDLYNYKVLGIAIGDTDNHLLYDPDNKLRITGTTDNLINISGIVSAYKHSATSDGYTRTGSITMSLPDAGDPIPRWGFQYNDPLSGNEMLKADGNYIGGFENTTLADNWDAYSSSSQDMSLIWRSFGQTANGKVRVIVVDDVTGDIYVGGDFTEIGGINAKRIAKYSSGTWSTFGTGANLYSVSAIAIDGSDLYIGGSFTSVNGVANTKYIAKWDGANWNSLCTTIDGYVNSLAIDASYLYVGGQFTGIDGIANTVCIARYNGTWSKMGTGADSDVGCMLITGGNLYIGGNFTQTYGVANTAHIAKWNGTVWSALGTGTNGNRVYAITTDGSGNLFACGDFTLVGGVANTSGIAKWNGATWSALSTGVAGVGGNYVTNTTYGGGYLYIIGSFTSVGGVSCNNLARWNGSTWSSIGTNITTTYMGSGLDIEQTPYGALYVGASYTGISNYIARYAQPDLLPSPVWSADTVIKHSGDKSAKFVGYYANTLLRSNSVVVTSSNTYNISGWIYGAIASIDAEWDVGSATNIYTGIGGTSEFIYISKTVMSPIGATTLCINIVISTSSVTPTTIYFDDISIKEVSSSNLYFNDTGIYADRTMYSSRGELAALADLPTLPTTDGWTPSPGAAWTYASATTINVPSGAASIYAIGDKARLKQGGGYKYFYVVGIADTLLTVTGGSDYSVANEGITDSYYSHAASPVGFPNRFSYNCSPTGFSGTPTASASFSMQGHTVTAIMYITGTSNSTGFTAKLPVANANGPSQVVRIYNNGTPAAGFAAGSGTTLTVYSTVAATGNFTNSGTKGLDTPTLVYYI